MRNEINRLVQTVLDPTAKRVLAYPQSSDRCIFIDPHIWQAFDTEMQSFFYLFTRYLAEKAKSQDL